MGAAAKRKVARSRKIDDDDDLDDDLPAPDAFIDDQMPWEKTDRFAKEVQEILNSVEAPPVDAQVHRTLQKHLYRSGLFGTDGPGHITLLVRTIIESENNRDALIEPIVSAVSSCMRPEWTALGVRWIECFDWIPLKSMLDTLRDLFGEQDLLVAAILEPLLVTLPEEKNKPAPKPPASLLQRGTSPLHKYRGWNSVLGCLDHLNASNRLKRDRRRTR